jgi:hypothetical protein
MTLMNGTSRTQRKTLASQLDRLDNILDALSDGLNEAVASTVEQAVGTAVSSAVAAVLTELLSNPMVVTRLRDAIGHASPPIATVAAPTPPPPIRASHFLKVKQRLASLAASTREKMIDLGGKLKGWLGGLMARTMACLRLAQPYRQPLLLSAGIGMAVGATAFFAGPWFAAATGCLAGFATTMGLQAALAFRRLVGMTNCLRGEKLSF